MYPDILAEIESEIVRLRGRYGTLMREWPEAREVVARWVVEAAGICWFVPLEDVAEPDIDVEITGEVLIVRASRTWPEPVVLVGLLPVPRGFDPEHAVIRFTEQTLEVRIGRIRGEGAR
ncbi:MAG: hypothetical protein ACYDIE_01865 [Candidatus Krumholzibacteriia bacterium]